MDILHNIDRHHYVKDEYINSDVTSNIIGACYEVHNTLGPGFEEVIYQRALAKELQRRNLEFAREENIEVFYKGEKIGLKRVDFTVENCLVEIKAKGVLEDRDFIQTLSYLKASGYKVGLLINFGGIKAEVRRLVN